MLTKKEFSSILTIMLVLGIIISILKIHFPIDPIQLTNVLAVSFALILLVIMINIITKKIVAHHLDAQIEVKIWELKRFGIKPHKHLRNYIQAGIFVPLIIKFVSIQMINWMACLTFDATGKVYRAARRHGVYSYTEVSEEEEGWIAGWGIIANILFGIIAYLINFHEFAILSLTYAFFNLIPIYDLDGAKIFFGNKLFWKFLAIIGTLGFLSTFFI